jgi:hypothetical protein
MAKQQVSSCLLGDGMHIYSRILRSWVTTPTLQKLTVPTPNSLVRFQNKYISYSVSTYITSYHYASVVVNSAVVVLASDKQMYFVLYSNELLPAVGRFRTRRHGQRQDRQLHPSTSAPDASCAPQDALHSNK